MPDAIAHHAHEPQEGDACERQQTQGQRDGTRSVFEPRPGIRWIGRDGKPDEHHAAAEQHREEDPGEGGGARRLECLMRQGALSVGHSFLHGARVYTVLILITMTETGFSPPQASGIDPQRLGACPGFHRL
jgi:hypothetical protein